MLQSSFTDPVCASRGHVLEGNPRLAHYFNIGAFNLAGRRGITQETSRHLLVIPALNTWLQRVFPSQTWTSLCINHNEQLALHRDRGNALHSLNHLIALGDFTSGQMFLEDASGDCSIWCDASECWIQGRAHDVLEHGLSFNAHLWHASMPWSGDRWAITAYTCSDFQALALEDRQQLQQLGFPLPADSPVPPPAMPEQPGEHKTMPGLADTSSVLQVHHSWSTSFLIASEFRGSLNAAFRAACVPFVHLQADEQFSVWTTDSVWERSMQLAFAGGVSFSVRSARTSRMHCVPCTLLLQYFVVGDMFASTSRQKLACGGFPCSRTSCLRWAHSWFSAHVPAEVPSVRSGISALPFPACAPCKVSRMVQYLHLRASVDAQSFRLH